MTYNEIINIARKLDPEIQQQIDRDVEERLEILREGDLNEEDMEKMEECLYISLVLQEYLNGEFELLDEEKRALLDEMEEMFNEYGELLTKAKLEEKLSKKKKMALQLMKIREELFKDKERFKDVNERINANVQNQENLKDISSKENMKEIAKESKQELQTDNKENKQEARVEKKETLKPENTQKTEKVLKTNKVLEEGRTSKSSGNDKKKDNSAKKIENDNSELVKRNQEKLSVAMEQAPNKKVDVPVVDLYAQFK